MFNSMQKRKSYPTERNCLCGKQMRLLMQNDDYFLWCCPPDGCGRLFLQSRTGEGATWYLAEMNERENIL